VVAHFTLGPVTTLPCRRINATSLPPRMAASAFASALFLTSKSVVPPVSRISHTGTPDRGTRRIS
jgi:hypothetical protein